MVGGVGERKGRERKNKRGNGSGEKMMLMVRGLGVVYTSRWGRGGRREVGEKPRQRCSFEVILNC
jgi:hypothetical protein